MLPPFRVVGSVRPRPILNEIARQIAPATKVSANINDFLTPFLDVPEQSGVRFTRGADCH